MKLWCVRAQTNIGEEDGRIYTSYEFSTFKGGWGPVAIEEPKKKRKKVKKQDHIIHFNAHNLEGSPFQVGQSYTLFDLAEYFTK